MAVLVCDASSDFDLVNRVIKTMKRLGAGPLATNFIRNYLDNSRQFVIIGDQESDMWSHSVGTGQGHVLSPPDGWMDGWIYFESKPLRTVSLSSRRDYGHGEF